MSVIADELVYAVVDCDVHHAYRRDDFLSYLPQQWQRFHLPDGFAGGFLVPQYPQPGNTNKRLDAIPEVGPAGSDYELLKRQLLQELGIERAVLGFDVGFESGVNNPHFAVALCRASNDWSIDHFLEVDERLFGGILIPTELPAEAAAEIRRLAHHPKMVEILMFANNVGRGFGHPFYDPIWEAAAEVGLPIAIHVGGDIFGKSPANAGGIAESRLELFALFGQPGITHLTTMLTQGVFERFPNVRVLLVEHGFTWVPSLLWRLDEMLPLLRRECPAVTRLPSEVFREHVRLTCQPFQLPEAEGDLFGLLESFGGMEDLLCFATDYPHWDADEPDFVARRLPAAWRHKVMAANSAALFGWDAPALPESR